MQRKVEDVKRDLSHVYWIGGLSKGGKSTVTKAIKEEFGFFVYDHDKKWLGGNHVRMADPDRHPTMFKYRDLYEDFTNQKFLSSAPIDTLVEDYCNFFIEQFEMVVDDLYELPRNQPIIAEGVGLLPESISRVADPHRAILLIPTEEFEREMLQARYQEKPDPLFDKDIEWYSKWRVKWSERATSQVEGLRVKIIETGGNNSLENTIDLVKAHFGLCS